MPEPEVLAPPLEEPPPEFVYFPGADVEVEVRIQGPVEAEVGRWYTLSATRSVRGTWNRVEWKDHFVNEAWFGAPPQEFEPEVAANLTWHTDPPGVAKLDCCGVVAGDPMKRQIQFLTPGTHKLYATSYPPIDAKSNVIEVRVSE